MKTKSSVRESNIPFSTFTLTSNPGLYFAFKTREVLHLNYNRADVLQSWGLTSVEEDLNKYYPLDSRYFAKKDIIGYFDSNHSGVYAFEKEIPKIFTKEELHTFDCIDVEANIALQRPYVTNKNLKRNYMPKRFVYRGKIGSDYRVINRIRGQFRGPRRFANILSFNGIWS